MSRERTRSSNRFQRAATWTVLVLAVLSSPVAVARGEVMDLANPATRAIEVQVWLGPGEHAVSPWARGSIAVSRESGRAVVRVPGKEVERALMSRQDVVRGSFSDMRWVFDVASGELLEAGVHGRIRRVLPVGPLRSAVEVDLEQRIEPRARFGAGAQHVRFGHSFFEVCRPDPDRDCLVVPTRSYRKATGEVLAPAVAVARWGALEQRAFSSWGRARFREARPACMLSTNSDRSGSGDPKERC